MRDAVKPIVIVFSLLVIFSIGVWGLGDALTPLILSFGLAYLVYPLIKKLEEKGVSRTYSVPGVFAAIVVVVLVIAALVLPGLISDGQSFLKELPANSTKALLKIELLSEQVGYPLDLSRDSLGTYIKEHVAEISGGLLKSVSKGLQSSFAGISKWLIAILNLFLIPLFFFYVINDYEKLTKELKSFIPKSALPKLTHYMDLSNTVLSGYIRGQLMVALALGGLYAVGLSIVGLKFGFLIGLLSGLISIIPYAGLSIGFVSALVIGLANYSGMGQIAGIVTVFLIVQALEGMVITPKLVGDKVGLSAFTTMLVLIIGGNLLGLMGMLMAIPVAAIIKSIIGELKQEYQQLDIYKA